MDHPVYIYWKCIFFLFFEIAIFQPSTRCLFILLFITPNVQSNLLICLINVYLSLVICPKPKTELFSYNPQPHFKPSTELTALNPLFILVTKINVYLSLAICPKPKTELFIYNPQRDFKPSALNLLFILVTVYLYPNY